MEKLARPLGLLLMVSLLTWLSPASSARTSSEVFLSNDTAQSKVTYVIQFETTVTGQIDKIRIALPPDTNAANAALGRLMIGDTSIAGSVAPSDPDTLIVDFAIVEHVKVGTRIGVELFNLSNPPAGNYAIDVRTLDKNGKVLEVIPPIAFSSFAGSGTGDITAVNTPPGSGLTGGATSGDVTLNVDTSVIQARVAGVCSPGGAIRLIDASGKVVCEPDDNSRGTVTSVGTGAGLTGGPITSTGTISVATSYQWPQGCAAGQVPKPNGSRGWMCANDEKSGGTVTAVTASPPLQSSGGTTPNISLPNVIIGSTNTAIGTNALLLNTTGSTNTAIGFNAFVNAHNKIRLGDSSVTLVETRGDMRVGAGTTVGCVQDGDGTVIAGVCASDARLKTDVRPFAPLLEKLVQLQPVYFHWKPEEYPELQLGSARSFGLIAQEAEKLLPELVTEESRGYKAVRYNMLPLMLLQALKEQQGLIQQQKAENAELKARLEALEQLVKKAPYLTASAEPTK